MCLDGDYLALVVALVTLKRFVYFGPGVALLAVHSLRPRSMASCLISADRGKQLLLLAIVAGAGGAAVRRRNICCRWLDLCEGVRRQLDELC